MRSGTMIAFLLILTIAIVFWYIVAYSFYDVSTDQQKKFVTDTCTLFFDGTWADCCVQHDIAYWAGGSAQQRFYADHDFRQCILHNTHNAFLAYAMYGVVRVSAVPYINTPWRWGYGWTFGRGYR